MLALRFLDFFAQPQKNKDFINYVTNIFESLKKRENKKSITVELE